MTYGLQKDVLQQNFDELPKKAQNFFKENEVSVPKYDELLKKYQESIKKIDNVILKKYISCLSGLDIVDFDDLKKEDKKENYDIFNQNKENKDENKNILLFSQNIDNVKIFKINKMVYEKNEFALHKFATVFNVFSSIKTSFFVIIDSDKTNTDFYMGIRSENDSNSIGEMIKSSMEGQFSGIDIEKISLSYKKNPENGNILKKINETEFKSISSVSCVADTRDENLNDNNKFVQGLEKLVLSMQGKKYTGIILANTTTQKDLNILRTKYEQIYTQLSSFVSKQLSYGSNFSIGESKSNTLSLANTIANTWGMTFTEQNTHSVSTSEKDPTSKAINATASVLAGFGIAGAPFTVGLSLVACGLAGCLGAVSKFFEKTTTITDSNSKSEALNIQNAQSNMIEGTYTKEHSVSQAMENSVTLNFKDKTIENILFRIEKQLKRIDEFESLGMFQCAAYFMSESPSIAEIVASTYKSIVCGNNSGVENSGVNTWHPKDKENNCNFYKIIKYVKNFIHPIFIDKENGIEVTPCSMVSGNELAILMGLPRKSVFGFPVLEHADFGKQVVTYDLDFDLKEADSENSKSEAGSKKEAIKLGCIFNMGKKYEDNIVSLDEESLVMHTFITGTTGSGKSNTIYELIKQLNKDGIKFMIIEPTKGEYKNVFRNIKVFGTNPNDSKLLKLNPFRFPKGIHIFEHIDRLVEIFNVCWPMYAAMPAFLKEAILESYKRKGFDLSSSQDLLSQKNIDKNNFPTFKDLNEALDKAVKDSAYSPEVKGNYIGSLVTRVKSLTNGINGQIFTSEEIDNKILFDENVIIDLSRIPSLETKSLIMGILIMRLSEYRMANYKGKMNIPLEHITVLEEAHHILKRTSKEQNPENPSISGKSVEMISNAIAEMRTYGEGFVIADQSPNEVDLSAIRNTNTKIIMRLPDEMDRRLAGKSAGLKEEQLDEIVKLPKGVAVVYQNNWVEPVLCKINKYIRNE